MSRWLNSTPQYRIQQWKTLRESLVGQDIWSQAQGVAEYFRDIPFGARSLDYYDPESWPTPWEILHHHTYCRSSGGILMHDTLKIINKQAQLELVLIDDSEDVYLTPLIENSSILNMVMGEISNLTSHPEVQILQRFHDAPAREY